MQASSKLFIGVDVSKDDLVAARSLNLQDWNTQNFSNDQNGIRHFIQSIDDPDNTHVILEATGHYSMKLTFALCEVGIAVSVLNPKQSKGFIQGVLLSVTKTDLQDACALALYGHYNQPKGFQPPDDNLLKVKQLRTFLRQCKKQKAAIQSQLHALDFHVQPLDFVRQSLEQSLELYQRLIKDTQLQLGQVSQQCFEQAYKLATSVIGVGPAIAQALLSATHALEDFQRGKQLVKFTGVCPAQCQSGSSIRMRAGMAKTGDPDLRGLLFMGARSAIRFNQPCKLLYLRLRRKGKCHKVAMGAVCNKLVRQIFAVVKSGIPFDNEYHMLTGKN